MIGHLRVAMTRGALRVRAGSSCSSRFLGQPFAARQPFGLARAGSLGAVSCSRPEEAMCCGFPTGPMLVFMRCI
jgi:hypothetical protein